jgi:hypothetical protein
MAAMTPDGCSHVKLSHTTVDTLVLAQSDLQNCEIINLGCFKVPVRGNLLQKQ